MVLLRECAKNQMKSFKTKNRMLSKLTHMSQGLLLVLVIAIIFVWRLREAESSGSEISSINASLRWDAYMIWLNENTFTDAISHVLIDPEHEFRGTVASRNIVEGEMVMFIPRKSLFTSKDVADGGALDGIPEDRAKLIRGFAMDVLNEERTRYDHSILSVAILWHRLIGTPKWSIYVNSLPLSVSGFPRYYNELELKLLEGTQTLALARKRDKEIATQYYNINKHSRWAAVLEPFTLEDYFWARDIVDSRSFNIEIKGSDDDAMIPLADLPNHDIDCPCSWDYDNEANGFVAFAECNLIKGDTVLMNYGAKPNSVLLSRYGFAVENSPHDAVDIVIISNATDTLYAHFARITKTFGPETEELLFEYIKVKANEAIDVFENPEKMQEEERLLSSEHISMNTRFALLARRSEYNVWKEWREVAIASLSDIWKCENELVPW